MPNTIRDLQVNKVPTDALRPYAGNARTHSRKQIEQIASSITAFGWTNPILIDEGNGIVAGHGRWMAAKQLGLSEVPVIELSGLSAAQKRAYILADNKLAENAGWDDDLLKIELGALSEMELDFDIGAIGFETSEIDLILACDEEADEPPAPLPDPGPAISEPGDLWVLGNHRLYCGDALKAESYEAVLFDQLAAAMFTDPPYNVKVDGHVCGKGKIKHSEFMMASGEMSDEEFCAFLETFCQQSGNHLMPGAVSFVCMDWRHIRDLIQAGELGLGELLNLCVWNKMTGGMGSLYRSQHELIPVFRKPGARHRNNIELGKHGRNRTNVWDYTGVQARRDELKLHPTVKPVGMMADAIMDVTARGEWVLDPFAGSGSTLLAAEQTGRKAACIELDPKYIDVIIRRFQDSTGQPAKHSVWEQSFDEIEKEKEASNV
ncbi:MAG: DNA methyltransferase [Pseudomonadota bacterium]